MEKKLNAIVASLIVILSLVTGVIGCSSSSSTATSASSTVTSPATASPAKTTATITTTTTSTPAPTIKTVTDLAGRTVTIPAVVTKVACVRGPTYDTTLMLGAKDKIGIIGIKQQKWAEVINPALAQMPVITTYSNPNVEELLAQQIQVCFYQNYPDPLKAMTDAGIAAVVSGASESKPETAQEFLDFIKTNIQLFVDVLGDEYQPRADAYFKYLDDTVAKVTSITATIPENERPSIYYINGASLFRIEGEYSNTRWWVEMAGGKFLTSLESIGEVSLEQVIGWNPDVIFLGRLNDASQVTADAQWSGIKAVQDGKVFLCPQGDFYWDFGVESPLLLMYLAKTLYPDKFADIDMVKETKSFYAQFFDYTLTDDQANRILNHQNPE